MHELGIVFYIIKDVKKVALENQVERVTQVTLSLGEVSSVIPDQLEDCWKWAVKKEPLMLDCQLKIEVIPAVTYCESCHSEYPTVQHGRTCPHCGSQKTCLLRGNEVEIKEISVI